MARFMEPSTEQQEVYAAFLDTLPAAMQAWARQLDPWTLYRLKSSGQRVTLRSLNEDGTVSVHVGATYNRIAFERKVFGIAPGDLEPCDLPGPDEPVGLMMTPWEATGALDAPSLLRRLVVWEQDANELRGRSQTEP